MDHKKSRRIMNICVWIGVALYAASFILVMLSVRGSTALTVAILGTLVIMAGAIQAYFHMRCPHCDGSLYLRGVPKPNFCPHCGKPIDW